MNVCRGYEIGFYDKSLKEFGIELDDRRDWTLEGVIVSVADEIAQRHHDIEDGIYSKLIDINDICTKLEEYGILNDSASKKIHDVINNSNIDSAIKMLGRYVVDYYVSNYINYIESILDFQYSGIVKKATHSKEDDAKEYMKLKNVLYDKLIKENKGKRIVKILGFPSELKEIDEKLSTYITNRVHMSQLTQSMDGKASFIIRKLMKAYLTNPQQLPNKTIISIVEEYKEKTKKRQTKEDVAEEAKTEIAIIGEARTELRDLIKKPDKEFKRILLRRTCDMIAGMTDSFAMEQFNKLYGTSIIIKN